ncbi:NUMOD1 domain-containing DNA-binding protein [Coprococcus comes]|uniref:NUMOD1 domain-containing DNA-binding protein n=1 Tax=Coprococcus comes TaxID=410072 RepID=UPI003A85EC32
MYESIADASRDTGINYNSIGSVARGRRRKAGGYTWEYVNPAPDKRDNRGCNQPTAKKVRCAETGNQFVSLSDAARAVGLRNGNSIRRAIDRGGTAGGYHWEYLDEKKEVSTDDHHQADGRAE